MFQSSAIPPPLASPGLSAGPITPAAPPSRSEIERKLSFKSAAPRDLPKKKRSPSQVSTDSDISAAGGLGMSYNASTGIPPSSSGSAIGSAPTSGFLSQGSSGLGLGGMSGMGSSGPSSPNPNMNLYPSTAQPMSISGLPSPSPSGPGAGLGTQQPLASLGGAAAGGGMHGLSAIADRLSGMGIGEEVEEYEEEHEHGNSGSEGEGEEEDEQRMKEQDRQAREQGQKGMDDERVLKSGYLYKKQEKRKVWKKKWFVLRTGKLAYYKDDREYSLSRVIDLRTIHTAAPVKIKKHSFTFGIVTKQRTFLAEASSQSEMDDWVAAITNARKRMTEEAERKANAANVNKSANAIGINTTGLGGKGGASGMMSPSSPHGHYSTIPGGAEGGAGGGGGGGVMGEMTMSPAQLHPGPGQGLPGVHYPVPAGGGNYASATPISIGQAPQQQQQHTPGQIPGTRRNPSMTSQSARSARREPSASSLSSTGHADYFPRNATASQAGGSGLAAPLTASAGHSPMSASHVQPALPLPLPPSGYAGQTVSSDSEDEFEGHANFSDFGTSVGTGYSHMDAGMGQASAGAEQGQVYGQGGMARSPSAGLTVNLNVPGTGKTITSQAQTQMQTQTPTTATATPAPMQTPIPAHLANVDPSRVIMSGYLMKRSHGRGRKVWRKRWWILTSAGLTYAKSHMDNKASRHIPLTSILDALEQPADSSQDASDSDSDGHGHGPQRSGSKSARSPSVRRGSSFKPIPMPGSGPSRAEGVLGTSLTTGFGTSHTAESNMAGFAGASSLGNNANAQAQGSALGTSYSSMSMMSHGASGTGAGAGESASGGDHLFRLITAKRTYTLCAPSEEDEIKWLAGVKALLNREREKSHAQAQAQAQGHAQGLGQGQGQGVMSAAAGEVPRMFPMQPHTPAMQAMQGQGQGQGPVPRITQQPPTPSLSTDAPLQSQGRMPLQAQQQQQQQQQQQPQQGSASQAFTSHQHQPESPTSPISLSGRGRSATYTAKSAVEEVGRRYHPERQQAQAS